MPTHPAGPAAGNRVIARSGPVRPRLVIRCSNLIALYPHFYWSSVSPQIQKAIRYLNVTSTGRHWVANLYSNVFCAERELSSSGPQR
jgi:hypothetical protein